MFRAIIFYPMRVVAGIILNEEGKILLTKRAEGQSRALLWEFPGGKVEPGETDQESLKRELEEELCLEVEVLEHLVTVHHSYPDLSIELVCYLCRTGRSKPCLTVHSDYVWVEFDELERFNLAEADRKAVEEIKRKKQEFELKIKKALRRQEGA